MTEDLWNQHMSAIQLAVMNLYQDFQRGRIEQGFTDLDQIFHEFRTLLSGVADDIPYVKNFLKDPL